MHKARRKCRAAIKNACRQLYGKRFLWCGKKCRPAAQLVARAVGRARLRLVRFLRGGELGNNQGFCSQAAITSSVAMMPPPSVSRKTESALSSIFPPACVMSLCKTIVLFVIKVKFPFYVNVLSPVFIENVSINAKMVLFAANRSPGALFGGGSAFAAT
ncbi:hypothetical protein [Paracandidimonas soli]|uniref:hypothetical protein n=1 Tax=Paracandidimonas soli TaxID=1917182 RepID=UPI0033402D30